MLTITFQTQHQLNLGLARSVSLSSAKTDSYLLSHYEIKAWLVYIITEYNIVSAHHYEISFTNKQVITVEGTFLVF